MGILEVFGQPKPYIIGKKEKVLERDLKLR